MNLKDLAPSFEDLLSLKEDLLKTLWYTITNQDKKYPLAVSLLEKYDGLLNEFRSGKKHWADICDEIQDICIFFNNEQENS